MIENTYGVRKIIMQLRARCFCPLGEDWYTSDCSIEFVPDRLIPDYVEVGKWLEENVDGKKMIAEEVADSIHNFFTERYKPKDCLVSCSVSDAKHCPITIIR